MSQEEPDNTAPPLVTWLVTLAILLAFLGAASISLLSMDNPLALFSALLS